MILTYGLSIGDVEFEKKSEIIASLQESIYDLAKEEAQKMIFADAGQRAENPLYVRKYDGMSWQEVFCRTYSLDYIVWENESDTLNVDWDIIVMNYADEKAEKALSKALSYVQLDVEI